LKTHIVIHHSATKDGDTFSWSAIRDFHKRVRGWSDVGYHWGIESVNGHLEIIQGRPTDFDGAHCKDFGMNQRGIGICLVGNFDLEVPSAALLAKARELVQWLSRLYGIRPENVIGHKEAQALAGLPPPDRKTCPGKLLDLDAFRASLK
jgi:N-acetylmuramoyl-L-alanine amidase